MGCSFSKNNNSESSKRSDIILNDLKRVTDTESAIRFLPEDSISIYFKDIPSTKLNTPFENGKTSIEVALERGNTKVIQELLNLGASPYIKNSKTHLNSIQIASSSDAAGFLFSNYLQESISKTSNFLFEKKYHLYLQEIHEKNLPCESIVTSLVRNRMSNPTKGAPREVIDRVLNASSCEEEFQEKKSVELFIKEFETQLGAEFSNILILQFLSSKIKKTPIALRIISSSEKTAFVSPASLALWSLNIKGINHLDKEILKIHNLTNFPRLTGLCISKTDSKTISSTDVCLTLEELLETKDPEILEALETKAASYSGMISSIEKRRGLK